ncbi:MAG TPA: hypothetical protein PLW65_21655 [Pseudomonadota bacterium]|nr:hypothetical protein [Pseudomonadota bacterium]
MRRCVRAADRQKPCRPTAPGRALPGWLLGPVALAAVLLPAGDLGAHPQFALSTVNRYGKVVLQGPRQTRVFYTLMVGDVPALPLRQQADRNGDGVLDEGEQAGLAAQLRERVVAGVHLYSGGAEVAIPWESTPLRLDSPAVAATAFACEVTATLPAAASGSVTELRYDDRVELPPPGEIELRVEEGPGMRVLSTQSSVATPATAGGAGSALVFQWSGPPRSSVSDRSVSIRYEAATQDAAAVRRRPSWLKSHWQWLLGALLALVAGLGLLRRRR